MENYLEKVNTHLEGIENRNLRATNGTKYSVYKQEDNIQHRANIQEGS